MRPARNEQAHTVGDVLLRRTRVGLLAGRQLAEPDCEIPRRVAEAVGLATAAGVAEAATAMAHVVTRSSQLRTRRPRCAPETA